MSCILAIDQSTSATKAVLFDARGKVLDKAALSHRQIYPQPGWVEHDPEGIWSCVQNVIAEVVGRNRARTEDLAAMSISNQRESVIIFDRKTGKPLHNALVWQDRRGDAICARLAKQGHGPSVLRKTGLKIDTYFSASKIRWLVENKPSIATKLKSGDAVIGTIDAHEHQCRRSGRMLRMGRSPERMARSGGVWISGRIGGDVAQSDCVQTTD